MCLSDKLWDLTVVFVVMSTGSVTRSSAHHLQGNSGILKPDCYQRSFFSTYRRLFAEGHALNGCNVTPTIGYVSASQSEIVTQCVKT